MNRRQRRRQTRRKGRRIGEGQYGFVVSPAIPCVGRNVSRKVSKLFKKQANLRNTFKNSYKNFATRKAQLTPVIEKLRVLDPNQGHFLYPEFCDAPGELTNELRNNGVTNESKHESYLMPRGGIPFKDLLEPFVEGFNAALKQDAEADYTSVKRRKEVAEKFFKIMFPLAKQADELLEKLFDANILHGDLHHGNLLILPSSKSFAQLSKLISVIGNIKSSGEYIDFKRSIGGTNSLFRMYRMTKAQTESVYELVDEFEPFDNFTLQIIDWDSATIVEDLTEDEKSDIRNDFLSMFFPGSHNTRYDFIDMYYDAANK